MSNLAPQSEFIGAAEAAQILGRSQRTLHRWASSGRLPAATKLPGTSGALLFRRKDVEVLAEKLTASAA